MPHAPIGGIELYYEHRGGGREQSQERVRRPRLLFVNGSGGDLRRPPVIFDSPLGEPFDVLAFDYRGLGQSSPSAEPFEMADLAGDAAALLDHVGWDRCHVFGISFGGMVAQEIGIRYPDRIDKLVLGCAPAGGAGGASYPLHTLGDMTPIQRARRLIPVLDTRRDELWQQEHPERFDKLVQEMAQILGNEDGATGLQLQLDARSRHDTWDRLEQLKMPVYVCGGKYDASATPESLQMMAARIPNAKFELFDGGHRFWLDDPTAYARIIEFLGG